MDERMTLLADGRLLVVDRGPILEIRLHRPEVHNALDEELISGMDEVFREIARRIAQRPAGASGHQGNTPSGTPPTRSTREPARPEGQETKAAAASRSVPAMTRGIILSAEGRNFCAGADLEYMQRVAGYSAQENRADAARLSAMFRSIRTCPVPVIARVQGAALGGGSGLAASCDIVVAAEDARFGFTEVRLGIVPAVISPFVIERIGPAHARALFPTGEIFRAPEALRIGLVDRVVRSDELDESVDDVVETLLHAAPAASREAKALVERVAERLPLTLQRGAAARDGNGQEEAEVFAETAALIAEMRARPEAREGMAAFLEKRKPGWAP